MNQKVENECFYTNVFCITAEGGVVPAELSLDRMSLTRGVEEVYQVFIEPGTLPKGYRAYGTENSKATHKIPLDLALFIDNYQQIVEDMLRFLMTHQDCVELPPPSPCTACLSTRGRTSWRWPSFSPGCRRTWLWRSGSSCTAYQFCLMSW